MPEPGTAAGEGAAPSLKRFFAPRAVALVGASNDKSKYGFHLLECMLRFGYEGKIYPVNPRYPEIQGLPAYPTLADLPDGVDHVGVVVPAPMVLDVLKQCEARGIPFATVFTGGFTETGTEEGRRLQQQITDFGKRGTVRMMGPNCNGFINFVEPFAMTYTGALTGPRKPAGRVGIVAQSGGLGQVNVMWRAQEVGLNVSYEVSCGNDADLDALDFMRFMIEDDASDVILVVAERFSNGAKLAEVARLAREREKPIVVLKQGRTEAGSRAAASHTGAVTGSDAVYDAAFRQYGLIRVEDFSELYEAAMLLRTRKWALGNGVSAMSISGGNVVLFTDLGANLGIEYPQLSPDTQTRLGELLPAGYGKVTNPVDLTTAAVGTPTLFRNVLDAVAADERVKLVMPILTFARISYLEAVSDLAAESEKPVAVLWTGGCHDDMSIDISYLHDRGVPAYRNTLSGLKAARTAISYGEFLQRTGEKVGNRTGPARPTRPTGPSHLEELRAKLRAATGPLTERASKEILAAYGFPVTREALAKTAEEAVRLAREIGYPVAMKIESADISHKTEAGAIRLGLTSEDAVRRAFEEVHEAARRYKPEAMLQGALVQEMVPQGVEVILGLSTDPTFGPVVAVGLGGVHVEVLRDVAFRIPPIDTAEAHRMLRELRAFKLLEGVRGAAPRDVEALAGLIVKLSALALDLGSEVAELDINPLVVLEQGAGARVVDALIVPRK